MTPDTGTNRNDERGFDMRWLADRLDNLEQQVDEKFEKVTKEIVNSRHGLREIVETVVIQVATLVTNVSDHERRLVDAEASGRRKGERIASLERWRSFLGGGLALLTLLFPTTIAVIVAVMKK
jgi:hypothetical protein